MPNSFLSERWNQDSFKCWGCGSCHVFAIMTLCPLTPREAINPFLGRRLGDLVFIFQQMSLGSLGKNLPYSVAAWRWVLYVFYILPQLHLARSTWKSQWPHADPSLAGINNHSSGGFQAFTFFLCWLRIWPVAFQTCCGNELGAQSRFQPTRETFCKWLNGAWGGPRSYRFLYALLAVLRFGNTLT